MARNTEPKLTASDGMDPLQRKALRLFAKITIDSPDLTSGAIQTYSELRNASSPKALTSAQKLALRAVKQMLETEADLEANPDPETAEAMRRAIASSESAHNPEDRRLARLGAFAMSVQAWQEQQPAEVPETQIAEQYDGTSAA